MDGLEVQIRSLKRAAEALIAHTSRIELRRRNQLQAEFEKLATPQLVLQVVARLEKDAQPPC